MQPLRVWTVILVTMRICTVQSIPAPDPNQPEVDKIILPSAFTEVQGTLWDCIKCQARCATVISICGAVCILPEPDMPFLCGVRITLSSCLVPCPWIRSRKTLLGWNADSFLRKACLATAGAKKVCIECFQKCFKFENTVLDCSTAEYLKYTDPVAPFMEGPTERL